MASQDDNRPPRISSDFDFLKNRAVSIAFLEKDLRDQNENPSLIEKPYSAFSANRSTYKSSIHQKAMLGWMLPLLISASLTNALGLVVASTNERPEVPFWLASTAVFAACTGYALHRRRVVNARIRGIESEMENRDEVT